MVCFSNELCIFQQQMLMTILKQPLMLIKVAFQCLKILLINELVPVRKAVLKMHFFSSRESSSTSRFCKFCFGTSHMA